MRSLLKKYLIIFVSIYLIGSLDLGLLVSTDNQEIFFAAVVLFLMLLVKPFIDALMLPINLLTLNLSNWLLFISFVFVWSVITPGVKFIAFNFPKVILASVQISSMMIPYWFSVILMSLLLVLTIKFLNWILK